jgi:hypothetical protein
MEGKEKKRRGAVLAAVALMMAIVTTECGAQTPAAGTDVVILDPSLPAIDILIAEMKPGSRIVYLKKTDNPIRSITKILKHCAPVNSLHVFLEGQPGILVYNDVSVTTDSLLNAEKYLTEWRQFFNDEGDVFLYGCEVGKGIKGLEFVKTFAMLTGLDVAASDNLTGSHLRGGDWFMEVKSGTIQNEIALDQSKNIEYPSLLRKEPVQARRKSRESI